MPEMLFVQNTTTPSILLAGLDDRSADQLCRVNNTATGAYLQQGSIFSLEDDSLSTNIRAYLNYLPAPQRQCIGNLAQACGNETLALAAFFDRYFSDENTQKLNSIIGAASTAAVARLDNFEKAIVNYQKSLNGLRTLIASNNHGRGQAAAIQQAKVRVREAYAELKTRYGIELQKFSPEAVRAKNRGTAFSNAERGITLATRNANSPKVDVRLNVEGQLQASQLARMGKLVNRLGNTAIVVDAGLRVVKVMDIEAEGGDWMREGAKQMTGFGLGAAFGMGSGKLTFAGGTYLAVQAGLTFAGPIGWMLLGGIFAGSLAVGYFVGSKVDSLSQDGAEWIMRSVD
ncbi:hypothetical protein [Thalassolituus sp.]|jgi:hypothetical protein|uniref:hypothetical protein n=1 Tax=Thalassolituus sp. TaxID=2030822 RepID=UPI002A7FC42E|nr:hypothetical protein [Thalassolituus sp.]